MSSWNGWMMSDGANNMVETDAVHLPNSFIDLMLVVGLDDNTGLIPHCASTQGASGQKFFSKVFSNEYEAQVLAAVSANAMVYFYPAIHCDSDYPPHPKTLLLKQKFQPLVGAHSVRGTSITPAMVSRHLSFSIQSSISSQNTSQLPVPELPLSEEAIKALTTFCFPDGLHVYSEKPSNSVHYLVLTNMAGVKTYATCLTFHRGFLLQKDDRQGSVFVQLDMGDQKDDQCLCYLPHCALLLSKYPYFYTMKDCLSCLVAYIEKDPEEMYSFVKETAHILTMAPVPPSGNVYVEFTLYQNWVALYPPTWPDKPVVDIPLHLVFVCLPCDLVLEIITAILCEEKIVFLSSMYGILTIVMESFLNFVLPFRWRYTYVPVLSSQSLELVEAPGVFMMGCHSKHKKNILQVEGLVVVDIDEGTVTLNDDPTQTDLVRIPALPPEAAEIFSSVYKKARLQFDVLEVERPVFYDSDEEKRFRVEKIRQFNSDISYGCLELMVNLFRCVVVELRCNQQLFKKEEFLSGRNEQDRPFYKQVLKTDMFKTFLNDRLQEKSDYWSDLEVKTRKHVKNVAVMMGTHLAQNRPVKPDVFVSLFPFKLSHKEVTAFSLPCISTSRSYMTDSITALTKALENCSDYEERGSLLYMRGMFLISDGNSAAAMEDLMSLAGINHRLLPRNLLRGLMKKIPDRSRLMMTRRPSFAHLNDLLHFGVEDEHKERQQPVLQTLDRDLSYDEFVNFISHHKMTNDADIALRLFHALTAFKQQLYVEQKTFEVFYHCWQHNHFQCGNIQMVNGKLHEEERILKISTLIKTDLGMGRIVLTDKRLFFLKDVSQVYQEIIRLRDIKSLTKLQLYSFLSLVDALRIHHKDGSTTFTAWLKEDRNWWHILIQEMWSGKVVAEGMRDINAVHLAAQNVLLIDAIIRSGEEECTAYFECVDTAASHLCHYTQCKSNKQHILPVDTMQALQKRIDPNLEQKDRQSVQALLYTPGDGNILPRLWCGMGDGKVRVFDAREWTLETEFVQTKSAIACLTAVGVDQIWAGSHGIFIIDTQTVTCTKTLVEHQDLVTAIAVDEENRLTYTASLDGVIIEWETQKLTIRKKFTIPDVRTMRSIRILGDKMYCGTWQHIWVLDRSGAPVYKLMVMDDSNPLKTSQLDCFEVVNNQIWAGYRREGKLIIWDADSGNSIDTIDVDCRGISTMVLQENKLWVGTKDGMIHIYHLDSRELWKVLQAHSDAVRCLCCAEERYVMSGAGSKDGKISVWSSSCNETESGNFVFDSDP
ncbi:hypothetical protein ScPMuIL_012765 [Solemya velum]